MADPAKGSRHNRGCAVDLTLYDLATGEPVEMAGGYDEILRPLVSRTTRAARRGSAGTATCCGEAMEAEGFTVYETEWWHFDYKDWRKYRIGNRAF